MDLRTLTMYKACLLHSRAERVLKGLVSRQLEEWGITRMEWLLLATVLDTSKLDLRKIPATSEPPVERSEVVSSFDEPTGSSLSDNNSISSPLDDPEFCEVLPKSSKNPNGHTMGEIAEQLDIRLSQLTALSSNMIKEGLLSQIVAAHDRRTKYLHVTPRGTKFLSDIENDMRFAMRQYLTEIPTDRLGIYIEIVEQLGNKIVNNRSKT